MNLRCWAKVTGSAINQLRMHNIPADPYLGIYRSVASFTRL